MKENDRFFVEKVNDGYLTISNTGFVRNNKTSRNIGAVGSGGYYKISVKDHNVGKIRHMQIHRLVFLIYVGDIHDTLQINHIDGNKLNNCVSNLELVTQLQNCAHANKMGLVNYCKAENNGQAKFKNDQVFDIRKEYAIGGTSIKLLSRKYDVSEVTISSLLRGKMYKSIKTIYDEECKNILLSIKERSKIHPLVIEEIKKLHRVEGLSSYKISEKLRINRNTVMKYW